jgi:hypothetical protein
MKKPTLKQLQAENKKFKDDFENQQVISAFIGFVCIAALCIGYFGFARDAFESDRIVKQCVVLTKLSESYHVDYFWDSAVCYRGLTEIPEKDLETAIMLERLKK